MKLIGMLDSPYVRRAAISLEMLAIPFEHDAVSVFTTFEQFRSINPVVKAPTLVCNDGEVIMDSSLILQFIEATQTSSVSLWAKAPADLQHEFRAVSLALAACEKSVQLVYERSLRPAAAQYEPWIARVSGQLLAAYAALEQEIQSRPQAFSAARSHEVITTAVAWQFTQSMLADLVPAAHHPGLVALSQRMEAQPEFLRYPPSGPGCAVKRCEAASAAAGQATARGVSRWLGADSPRPWQRQRGRSRPVCASWHRPLQNR